MAVSADDSDTQKRFRAELGATFSFVADPDAKLIELYDVKVPILTLSNRTTFVIDKDRKVTAVQTGGDALDPSRAVDAATQACGA